MIRNDITKILRISLSKQKFNQNAFSIGKNLIHSLENNYSTKILRKENCSPSFRTTRNKTSCESEINPETIRKVVLLDSLNFKEWTTEQVCSLLCSEREKGGADLNYTEVAPLYEVCFSGSSLANIADWIDSFGYEKALTLNAENLPGIPKRTISRVVIWFGDLLKRMNHKKAMEVCLKFERSVFVTPEHLKGARTDTLYDYLRNLNDPTNMDKLEKMIGQNISLPILGEEGSYYVPKDFNPKSPYLLTRQRFEILKKVIQGKEGFVISGPHGISKSYSMCLIAAYAIVNSIPLLYVPRCGMWAAEYFDGAQQGKGPIFANNYLRSLVLYWNSDILNEQQINELIDPTNTVSASSAKLANNQNVFHLFDEHDELCRPTTDGKKLITERYFRDYTRLTNTQTITVYCSSSYCVIEDSLPKVIRISPPSLDEFNILVSDFGLNSVDKRIDYVTGRIPKELSLLSHFLKENNQSVITDEIISQFMITRVPYYESRLTVLVDNLEKLGKKQDFFKTLEQFFALGFYPCSTLRIDYDEDLFYRNSSDKLVIVNEPAKRALFSYYCQEVNKTKEKHK